MADVWELHLPSNAEPRDKRGMRYQTILQVDDLSERLENEISRYEREYSRYWGVQNGRSQNFQEYRALIAFRERFQNIPEQGGRIDIASGELPLSFNDDIFAGHFISVTCYVCGATNPPWRTFLQEFSDTDGMQYYGKQRYCPCGQSIAYKLEGYRRP